MRETRRGNAAQANPKDPARSFRLRPGRKQLLLQRPGRRGPTALAWTNFTLRWGERVCAGVLHNFRAKKIGSDSHFLGSVVVFVPPLFHRLLRDPLKSPRPQKKLIIVTPKVKRITRHSQLYLSIACAANYRPYQLW